MSIKDIPTSSHHSEDSQKWHHSLAMQIPLIFDGRFKDSILCVGHIVQSMSALNNGSRIWVELGIYINKKGGFALDLNVWVKSQMDEEKFNLYVSQVREWARQTRDKLRQEAIVVEIDGYMECH
jgi:hypothetical protein